MNNHARDVKRSERLSPCDLKLHGNPLDFIHEDHLREREFYLKIDALAQSQTPDHDVTDQVLSFLESELPLHLEDEEQDLFPLLVRRCKKEDQIDKAIQRLKSGHGHADEDTSEVLDIIQRNASRNGGISEEERGKLTRFASHARRQLILKNAVILPFARLRLTQDDLETLRLRMMQRRGLDKLVETEDAE